MTEPRKPIFDRAFEAKDSIFLVVLKNRTAIFFKRRSEIWKDKANNPFFTAYEAEICDPHQGEVVYDEVDIRFNDISLITEAGEVDKEKVELT